MEPLRPAGAEVTHILDNTTIIKDKPIKGGDKGKLLIKKSDDKCCVIRAKFIKDKAESKPITEYTKRARDGKRKWIILEENQNETILLKVGDVAKALGVEESALSFVFPRLPLQIVRTLLSQSETHPAVMQRILAQMHEINRNELILFNKLKDTIENISQSTILNILFIINDDKELSYALVDFTEEARVNAYDVYPKEVLSDEYISIQNVAEKEIKSIKKILNKVSSFPDSADREEVINALQEAITKINKTVDDAVNRSKKELPQEILVQEEQEAEQQVEKMEIRNPPIDEVD